MKKADNIINIFFPEKVYNLNKDSYNPIIFKKTFYEVNPLFQKNENIELKIFIDYLILKLHVDLNSKKKTFNDINMENVGIKNENDVLTKNLYGIIKYTFYCHQCLKTFFNFQCYSYLYSI